MQKEEILALIDRLYLDQSKHNRFLEYLESFLNEPRCKKGCLGFINELFNLPDLAGRNELAMRLTVAKSDMNASATVEFVRYHPISLGYSQALGNARITVLKAIQGYILDTARRLSETTLLDKGERQVYLRRAVGRLLTVLNRSQQVIIRTEQWSEIEVDSWIDYLNDDLETLVGKVCDEKFMKSFFAVGCSPNTIDHENTLGSLKSYLNYLDTFVEY